MADEVKTEKTAEQIAQEKKAKAEEQARQRYARVKSHMMLVQQIGEPAGSTLMNNVKGVKDFKLTPLEWQNLAAEINADVNTLSALAGNYDLVKAYGSTRSGETPRIAEICGFKSVANLCLDEDDNINPEFAELADAGKRVRQAVDAIYETMKDDLKIMESYTLSLEFFCSNEGLREENKLKREAEKLAKQAAEQGQLAPNTVNS